METKLRAYRPTSAIAAILLVALIAGCADSSLSRPERLLGMARVMQKTSPDKAIALAKEAADLGFAPAMIALGNWEVHGKLDIFLKHDSTGACESNEWFRKARQAWIDEESGRGLANAAYLYRLGLGGPADPERANELAVEAAKKGHDVAVYFQAVFAANKGQRDLAEKLIEVTQAEGLTVAYRIQAFLNAIDNPKDVIAYAEPLYTAVEKGDREAEFALKELAYSLNVSAANGEASASDSIHRLKASHLWVQPEADFYPGKRDWAAAL